MMHTRVEFEKNIKEEAKSYKNLRKGQGIFNAVEILYGIARVVQFHDGIDCFYDDSNIDKFIEKAYETYVDLYDHPRNLNNVEE